MASPQTENGYTRIANEIIDHLSKYRLSGEEWMVLLVVWRNTYGFQKLHGRIPLGQFSLSTGLKKPTVYRALLKMITKNIINKDNETYSFVKDFDTWKALSKKITLSKKIINVIKKDNDPLSKKITPTISKEIIKKERNTTGIQEIVNHFKVITGNDINDKGWDTLNYARNAASAKLLLGYFNDVEKAKLCIVGVKKWAEENGLDWKLETVVKRATDWNNGKLETKEVISAEPRKLVFKGIVKGSDQ